MSSDVDLGGFLELLRRKGWPNALTPAARTRDGVLVLAVDIVDLPCWVDFLELPEPQLREGEVIEDGDRRWSPLETAGDVGGTPVKLWASQDVEITALRETAPE